MSFPGFVFPISLIAREQANRYQHDSFSFRQFLYLFLLIYTPLTLGLLALLYAVMQVQVNRNLGDIATREAGQVEVAAHFLSYDIKAMTSDLQVLARDPSMYRYFLSGNDRDRNDITQRFRNLAEARQIYDQIRFIGADGFERIRVNYSPDGARVVTDAELQDKGKRYYFRDSISLEAGQIYMSPLDLNIEHQRIERPFKPMLRLGTPVFDQAGVKRGVIILNVLGKQLLDDFRNAMGELQHAMLINRDGYWLSHPDQSLEWGFMFGNQYSLAKSSPRAWQSMLDKSAGSFQTDAGFFTFATVYPLQKQLLSSTGSASAIGSSARVLAEKEYFWKVVSLVDNAELEQSGWYHYQHYVIDFLFGLLLLAVLVGFLAFALLSRRNWRQAVFDNETKLREITATLGEGVYVLDKQGLVTFVNPEACKLLGWSEDQLIGKRGHETFHYSTVDGKPLPVQDCPVHQTIDTGQVYRGLVDYLIRNDGTLLPVSLVSSPIIRNDEVVGSVAAFQDISNRLQAEKDLRDSELRFRNALEHAPIGMAILSLSGDFTLVNHALSNILNYSKDELESTTLDAVTLPDDRGEAQINVDKLVSGEIDVFKSERRFQRKDNTIVWTQLTASMFRDSEFNPLRILVQIEDITLRKQQQEQIRKLAYIDSLTHLPNRRMLLDLFNQALTQAQRFNRSLALLFVDLDRFKQVNDSLGHGIGDELLIEVAGRLKLALRSGDIVARQGGDEFIVVLNEISHADDAAQIAEKIINTISKPYLIKGHELTIGASIGIALYPEIDTDDVDELIRKADIAMYSAKASGRNRYHFYGEE